MRPIGRSKALMRAGAIGDKGSTAIATFGCHELFNRTDYVLFGTEICCGAKMHVSSNIEAVTLRQHQGSGRGRGRG